MDSIRNLKSVSRRCLLVADLMEQGIPAINTISFSLRRSIELLEHELGVYGYRFGDSIERGVGWENRIKDDS